MSSNNTATVSTVNYRDFENKYMPSGQIDATSACASSRYCVNQSNAELCSDCSKIFTALEQVYPNNSSDYTHSISGLDTYYSNLLSQVDTDNKDTLNNIITEIQGIDDTIQTNNDNIKATNANLTGQETMYKKNAEIIQNVLNSNVSLGGQTSLASQDKVLFSIFRIKLFSINRKVYIIIMMILSLCVLGVFVVYLSRVSPAATSVSSASASPPGPGSSLAPVVVSPGTQVK
jgi:hypothetical protein